MERENGMRQNLKNEKKIPPDPNYTGFERNVVYGIGIYTEDYEND